MVEVIVMVSLNMDMVSRNMELHRSTRPQARQTIQLSTTGLKV